MALRQVYLPGGASGPVTPGAAVTTDELNNLELLYAETNLVPTDLASFELDLSYAESNSIPAETLRLAISGLDETNPPPADSSTVTFRHWAISSEDNAGSATTPANANGQPNGVFANVRTAAQVGNITNPVEVVSSTVGGVPVTQPAGLIAKRCRIFYTTPARAAALDTVTLQRDAGSSSVRTILATIGTAAENFGQGTNGRAFSLDELTWSAFRIVWMFANYQAVVVASPETAIQLDAWCLEYDVGGQP